MRKSQVEKLELPRKWWIARKTRTNVSAAASLASS
jgi:hypothetical protein